MLLISNSRKKFESPVETIDNFASSPEFVGELRFWEFAKLVI